MNASMRSLWALSLRTKIATETTVRQQRPGILFYRQRIAFSTRPFVRQQAAAGIVQDVPDAGVAPSGLAVHEPGKNRNREDEDWHAEIELKVPTIDEVIQDDLPIQMRKTEEPRPVDKFKMVYGTGDPTSDATEFVSPTKEESRKARKLRRQEAGIYAPKRRARSLAKEANAGDKTNVEDVLKKIEAMPGPSVTKRTPPAARSSKNGAVATEVKKDQILKETSKATDTPSKPFNNHKKETWQIQKAALQEKFGETGWQPRKRLSPDTLEGIRALHKSDPAQYSTAVLAQHFKITPEAIRRILKSKWKPSEEEVEKRRVRWERRGVRKWTEMAEQGAKPPAKWRALGVKSPQAKEREKEKKDEREDGDEFVKWAE